MEELKNCPFCDGKPFMEDYHGDKKIQCSVCGVHIANPNPWFAWNTRPHPQRDALDEEKVWNLVEELERNGDLPLNTTERILIKAICAKFGTTSLLCKHKWSHPTTGYGYQVCMNEGCNVERFCPSLSDLLSALPEDGDMVTPEGKHGWNSCIAALKGLWK